MRLIVLENGAQIAEVNCRQDAIHIGTREGCAIRMSDERVAEQHAVIYPQGDGVWLIQNLTDSEDLTVNDAPINDAQPLIDGDRITLFDLTVQAQATIGDEQTSVVGGRTTVERMTRFVRYQLPPGAIVRKSDDSVVAERGQMMRLGRIGVDLAQCQTPEQFIDITLRSLLETFSVHRAWIGVRRVNYGSMEYVEGRLLTGQTAELPETGESLKPRVLDRAQFVLLPRASDEVRTSVITGPLLGPDGTLGMVYLDTGDTRRRLTEHELDYFILLLSAFGVQLDAIFQYMARQRAAIVDGEVAVAHAIQARLTPRKLSQWNELQFGAFREPGRERTSDVYDIVRLSNQMAAFMIARTHVAGPLPGMHMAQAQSAFRTACMHMDAPHIFLRTLNVLLHDGESNHVVDCLMGVIDPASGKVRVAIAGAIGAYIIGARGEERKIGPDEPLPAVGATKTPTYETLAENLDNGETLALFTPGVVTARNANDEAFGEARFVDILCDGFGQLASAMLKEMLTDLQSFTEGGSQPEDITVILAHRV